MNACKVLELVSNNNVDEIIRLAKLEIKGQVIKEKGGNKELKRFKAVQRYIKNIEKRCIAGFNGTWEEQDKQCFSDGYTAFILKNKIEGLPKNEKQNLDLHTVLKDVNANNEINVDIKDIKVAFKIHKAKYGRKYPTCQYNLGISLYNAEYILNCYDILGGNIIFRQSQTNELSPAILESENGIAILSPIRKNIKGNG